MSLLLRAGSGRRLPWARELERVSGLGGRRIGPPFTWRVGLVLVLGFVLALPFVGWWLIARTAEPAETLSESRTLLGRPPALDSARYVAWRHVLAASSNRDESGIALGPNVALVEPKLPPALCQAPRGRSWGAIRPEIRERIRDLVDLTDRLSERAMDRDRLQRALIELRNTAAASPAEDLLLRYNGARAYLALEDAASANQVATGDLEAAIGRTIAPVLRSASNAPSLLSHGDVTQQEAALAFYVRYLSGSVALERGLGSDAVRYFRLALNAVNYVLARRPATTSGHFVRTPIALGDLSCAAEQEGMLGSLDAYLGLVAAYLRNPDFTDASRLAGEVARDTRLDIEPSDPLLPFLRQVAETGGSAPMPEHFVWAVSNLQRLSHFNRGDPHLRIEAARALVALDAVRRPTWRAAVGITDPCPSLRQIVEDLERAGRRASASGEPRFAAAALLTHGALEAECGASHNGPDPQTQSAWLVASAGVLGDGTAAFAESLRRDLQTALAIDRPDVEAVTDVLRRAATVESELARGRRPEGFERVAAPRDGARFLGKWRQAIHFGVAVELVAAARAVSGGPVPGVSGATAVGSVDAGYIATVDDLASYAGRAPRALYGAREFAAAHSSWFEALEAWLRYRGRSYPAVAWAVLGLFTATLAGIVLIANLSLWRVRLYRTSLYRAELDPEGLAPGPEPGAETADRSAIGPA